MVYKVIVYKKSLKGPEPNMEEKLLGADQLIPVLVGSYMHLSEFASDIAYCRRTLYEAYLSEGFEPAQALDLCKLL